MAALLTERRSQPRVSQIMVAGAAMMTPNVVKNLTPVVKGPGLKNAIAAIQTLTKPTLAEPANRPTSKPSDCRRDRPLLHKETPTGTRNPNAKASSPMTNNMAEIRRVLSRSEGPLSVAFGPMVSASRGFHVRGVLTTMRPARAHQRSPRRGHVTTPRFPARCPRGLSPGGTDGSVGEVPGNVGFAGVVVLQDVLMCSMPHKQPDPPRP